MKKYILLFLMLFCINIMTIKADDEYVCAYSSETGIGTGFWEVDVTHNFSLKINSKLKVIGSNVSSDDEKKVDDWETAHINFLVDEALNSSQNSEYYVKLFDNYCPATINVCKYVNGADTEYGILFNSSYISNLNNLYMKVADQTLPNPLNAKAFSSEAACKNDKFSIGQNGINCQKFEYKGCQPFAFYDGNYANKGEAKEMGFSCNQYSNDQETGFLDLTKKSAVDYHKCKIGSTKNCSLSSLAKGYNNNYDILKQFCTNVIKNQNAGDSCMTACLGLDKDLDETYEINGSQFNYRINNTQTKIRCHLTDDILSIVYNVLKWAKYIAPVIAIILSILDFIKAIASQNEDDMKKAQGKFIKRLIVAALLFLVPLIINFMLGTFGLYNSSCDIAEIFS